MTSPKNVLAVVSCMCGVVFLFGLAPASADWVSPSSIYDNSPLGPSSPPISSLTDGDPNTFIRLTNGGDPNTEPARGYVVFDLGSPQSVQGIRYQSTDAANHPSLGPMDTDVFYWSNETTSAHQLSPNTIASIAADLNVVVAGSTTFPAATGANQWLELDLSQPFTARYVGVRFTSGYDTPARAGIFMAEMQVNATPTPEPAACILLVTSLLGMLAYAWRKRK